MSRPPGTVYGIPPQPPDENSTRWFPAGALTIGVEYRDVNPDDLVKLYEHDPAQLQEMLEKSPDGGFSDEGVSLHVTSTEDGHEYLRFDVFDDEPHYHYVHNSTETKNHVVIFDTVAHGDMLPWAFECLRSRLPEMLTEAEGAHLVDRLDPSLLGPAIDAAADLANEARANIRAVKQLSR